MRLVLLTLILVLASTYSLKLGKDANPAPAFNSKEVKCSMELYDLFENDSDSIYLTAFTLGGDEHEKHINSLAESFKGDKSILDKLVYIPVDANDKYQYKGILYDLEIINESHTNFPYFLVVNNQEGHIVRGPQSAQTLERLIKEFGKKSS